MRMFPLCLCSLALSVTGCMGGPDAPSQAAVVAAVTDSLARQEVAVRLIDQEVGLATDWQLDLLEQVQVVGEPQGDGPNGAWTIRVSLRGSWSGAMPDEQPQARNPAATRAQPAMQPTSEPPPWVAKQIAESARNAPIGSPSTDPRVPKDWAPSARQPNQEAKPSVVRPQALRKKQSRSFERTVTVRVIVDPSGSVRIP